MLDTPVVTPADSARQSTRQTPTADPRLATRVVLAALAGGLLLELLLRAVPPGINVALAAVVVAVALLFVTRAQGHPLALRAVLMTVLVALGSIAAVRGESLLWLAMFAAMVATVTLAALPSASWLRRLDPIDLLVRALVVLARCAAGPLWMLTRIIDWKSVMPADRAALRHARGVALAVPVILPFLLLFASADPAFEAIALRIIDLPQLLSHVALWGVFAWLGLGWLGVAVFPAEAPSEIRARLGASEANWVLGLLALLFGAFVAVQFRYFFGGDAHVQTVAGLSYAEYARRGFFELVTVAALLLVVLLVFDWLTRHEATTRRVWLKRLALLLIALLGVILVSAVQRMQLYIAEYGLTELRFFTTAFMFWLIAVFGWFGVTVLRDRREPFLAGVYATGVAAVLLLAAIDPIGRIATHNVEHARRTGRFDTRHMASIGADAVPAFVGALALVPAEERCQAATSLLRWTGDDSGAGDARSWNRSRARARALVQPLAPSLARECDPPLQIDGGTP